MGTLITGPWWVGDDSLPASSRAALAGTKTEALPARLAPWPPEGRSRPCDPQTEAPPRLTELPPCPRPRNASGARGEAWPVARRERARAVEPTARPRGRGGARSARPRPLVLRLAWAGGVITASLYLSGLAEMIARGIA